MYVDYGGHALYCHALAYIYTHAQQYCHGPYTISFYATAGTGGPHDSYSALNIRAWFTMD